MAGHQWSWWVCFGHDRRRDHPPLPLTVDRGTAAAARPHVGGVQRFRTLHQRPDGTAVSLHEHGQFIDFTPVTGLPNWRYEIDGMVIEKSIVLPPAIIWCMPHSDC
jgi:hypothetical protein